MTFWDYYTGEIQPQIRAIDLYLKTEDPPYDIEAVSEVLHISAEEAKGILEAEKLAVITKSVFFRMLARGSAPLCGMFRRALACGLPEQYSCEQIAYIFALEIASVWQAAETIGTTTFSEQQLPRIFQNIKL